MMRRSPILAAVLLAGVAVAAASSPARADIRRIGTGATLSPMDMGHIFAEVCFAPSPKSVVRNASAMGRVLSLENAQGDGKADVDLADLSETLRLTVHSRRGRATCTMVVDAEAAGDGADLYESVEEHLYDWREVETEAEYVDGGLTWRWSKNDIDFALTFTEAPDAFTLAFDVEG